VLVVLRCVVEFAFGELAERDAHRFRSNQGRLAVGMTALAARSALGKLPQQPQLRIWPVTLDRVDRNTQRLGGFLETEPASEF
jgi:hypothetical protein